MKPSEIEVALQRCSEVQLPVMMWGSPGVGKSSIVAQIGRKSRRPVFDIRLALLDPTDLRGIPFYNPNTETAEWAQASILPGVNGEEMVIGHEDDGTEIKGKHENAIVFLDEINAAPPVVQAAAYQLVLDRRIGDYHLPDGVAIIAAGNREGDKAVTFKMPTPLLNRFVHLEFKVDFEDWHNWAVLAGIQADVVGFLNFKKNMLNQFDAQSKSRAFPTPRSWEFVSRALVDRKVPDNVMRHVVDGCVGQGAAIEFMAYRDVYLKLPDPAKVLDGEVKKMPTHELSAAYAMITALSYELKHRHDKHGRNKKFFESADRYMGFIHENFKPEFCVMGVRDCLKAFKLPMVQAPDWKKFAKDYTKLVMAA